MSAPAYYLRPRDRSIPLTVGSRHGELTIVARAPSVGTGARYRVRCEQGHERVTRAVEIRSGKTGCPDCRGCGREPEAAE